MKSGTSANQLWTQQPVASRLVEVNTKTGFSLTAGSYSIRESSTQNALADIPSSGSLVDTAISAVTLANTHWCNGGGSSAITTIDGVYARLQFMSTTSIRHARTPSPAAVAKSNCQIVEFF